MPVVASASVFLLLPPEEVIYGASEVMQKLRDQVARVALAHEPVLIYGETGTGKEIIAHLIHRHSPLGRWPFRKGKLPFPSRHAAGN